MRLILAAAGVLALGSASLAQEAPKVAPASSQVVKHRKVVHRFGMSGDQIRQALAGNTISGIEIGKEYSEYYSPDGFLRGRDSEGPYTGQWVIRGAQVCVRYHKSAEDQEEGVIGNNQPTPFECMGVSMAVSGGHFAWVEDGEFYPAWLRFGNPNHL